MAETAASPGHAGRQLRVWISEDVYDLLKARTRRHGTSLAEEARRLMQLGLADRMTWAQLEAAVDHLERLAHDTAVNARLLTAVEESKARVSFRTQNAGQPEEEIRRRFRRHWSHLRQEASDTLAEYLRAQDDPQGGE